MQDLLQLPSVTPLPTQLWGSSSQQLLPTLAEHFPVSYSKWTLPREEGTPWACSMSWKAGNTEVGKVAKPGSQMEVECQHPATRLLPGQEEE